MLIRRHLQTIDPDCGAHIALAPTSDWDEDGLNEPLLYAGFYFATPTELLPAAFCADDSPIAQALSHADVRTGLHPNRKPGPSVRVSCPWRPIVANGGSLREQAEYAACWAAAAIEQISGFGTGESAP